MKKFKKRATSKNVNSRRWRLKVKAGAKRVSNRKGNFKDTFIDVNVEPSPYEVYVAMFVMKNGVPLHLVQLTTERNSFSAIIEYTKTTFRYRINHSWLTHHRLAEILTDRNVPKDDLGTIILNYMACFEAELGLDAYPEHFGYIMHFDGDDPRKCVLDGGAKHDIERLFLDVIGKPLNESINRETD